MKIIRYLIDPRFASLAVLILLSAFSALSQTPTLSVTSNKSKVERGGNVEITIRSTARDGVRAVLFVPSAGTRDLALTKKGPGEFTAVVETNISSPAGLYVVHAWRGERSTPTTVGKASFRVGNIVADFLIANLIEKKNPEADLDAYFKDFRAVGGNFLIAHNLVIATGAFYPSKITRETTGNDLVELLLDRADREGYSVLLSVSWDITRATPYKDRMVEVKAIASELYTLYRHHPSLAGFYSWQEGSGTYYAAYAREFSEHIKGLDRGLITACAPHIDDPLLASYLSVIEDLDMMIYQSAVMASYRPDNRKEYPLRRVRDFSGLGSGAKRVMNKIVLTHVELFAYMEKRQRPEILTASYEDIYGQILSAATVTDTDGIALFAYHAHIYGQSKQFEAGKRGRDAVKNGLNMYEAITSDVSKERNPLALYIPYSDFVIERWNNYFLPALDAFRKMGVPVDILPYAPRVSEGFYPYYPIHMNDEVLKRLLEERTVLLLANVSGFQQTDSDLIKAFVDSGGVVVAFGPQIPYGRTFERMDLFGGESLPDRSHTRIAPVAGATTINSPSVFPRTSLPSWKPGTATVLARYEDGTAAVLSNKFGKGTVFTVLPDVTFSSVEMPNVVRGVLNNALRTLGHLPLVEIAGMDKAMDISLHQTSTGMSAAIVNYNSATRRVSVTYPKPCSLKIASRAATLRPSSKTGRIEFVIPGHEVAVIKCR